MRIGFSTSVIQRGKTGIAQYVFALLRAFDELDDSTEFVLYVLDEDQPHFAKLSDRFNVVPVGEEFRPAIKNIRWHQMILPRLAREHRLDAVHVPSYRRLMWSAPCPRVATIHDLAPFRVSGKYDLARMFYGRVVVKRLARRQNAIVAVSGNTAQDISRFFGIGRDRVRVIHNGLDHSRFHPLDRALTQPDLAKFELAKPFLLYVARLEHPGKNHVRLIEAFEQFKRNSGSDWQLALGGSDWHGAEVIHERIAASPFRQDIRPLGFVPDDSLPGLYSAASVFIYPSLYEGFGMPPVEAMACGCPVICSDRGSLGEVVADAARIVDPERSEDMTAAIAELCGSEEERKKWIQKGKARAAEFSWKKAALATMEVYARATKPTGMARVAAPVGVAG
jgi:glycosyltransferase involved in cell wall biosynthesis